MRKAFYILLGIMVIASLLMSACGQSPTTKTEEKTAAKSDEKTPAKSEEKTAAKSEEKTVPASKSREDQLIEGAKKEGQLNVWTYAMGDKDYVLKPFKEKYPFIDVKVWDSRGGQMLSRLIEESKAGKVSADVIFLSSEMQIAQERGLIEEYEFPNTANWPHQPSHNFFRRLSANTRVLTYNSNQVAAADIPKSWDDLKSPKWKERAIVSTSGEDTPLFFAYLWRKDGKLNWDDSFSFWEEVIKNNKPSVDSGYTGILGRVAAGEFAIMPGATGSTSIQLIRKKAPIKLASTSKVPGIFEMSVALVKNAPNPNAAKVFIDYYTTLEGAGHLVYEKGDVPLNPAIKSDASQIYKDAGIEIDFMPNEYFTEENIAKSSEWWFKALGVKE